MERRGRSCGEYTARGPSLPGAVRDGFAVRPGNGPVRTGTGGRAETPERGGYAPGSGAPISGATLPGVG